MALVRCGCALGREDWAREQVDAFVSGFGSHACAVDDGRGAQREAFGTLERGGGTERCAVWSRFRIEDGVWSVREIGERGSSKIEAGEFDARETAY